MRRYLKLVLCYIMLPLAASPYVFACDEPANIYDHAMTHSVSNSYPYLPADRITSFSANDIAAYSWLEVGRDLACSHQVSWNWYSPDGDLFKTDSSSTGKVVDGDYYKWVRMASPLPIRGYKPGDMPGNWKVKINLDGQYILTEYFSII